MGNVFNLRQARKRAARKAREAQADGNRRAYGLPPALRTEARRENKRATKALDGHRLEGTDQRTDGSTD